MDTEDKFISYVVHSQHFHNQRDGWTRFLGAGYGLGWLPGRSCTSLAALTRPPTNRLRTSLPSFLPPPHTRCAGELRT